MAFRTSADARWTILSSSAGTPTGQPVVQVLQACLQVLPVAGPGLAIHSGGRIALAREVGLSESLDLVDVVHQRGELRPASASCRLSYAIERSCHVIDPARSPGHALLDSISLGPRPSLHHLRRLGDCTRAL